MKAVFRANLLSKTPQLDVAAGATCGVFVSGTNTMAELFADELGTQPIPNPVEADPLGWVEFYVDGGKYDLVINEGDQTRTISDMLLLAAADGVGHIGTAAPLSADDDETLAADSDERVATQKAVKAYIDDASVNSNNINYEFKVISDDSYTISEADNGFMLWFTSDTDITVTLPDGTMSKRVNAVCIQAGDGEVTFVGGGSAVVHSEDDKVTTAAKYAPVSLAWVGEGQWYIGGRLV